MNVSQVGLEKRRGTSKYLVILALGYHLPLPTSLVPSHSGRGVRGRRWLWAHNLGRSVVLPLSSVRIFRWKLWPLNFSKTIFLWWKVVKELSESAPLRDLFNVSSGTASFSLPSQCLPWFQLFSSHIRIVEPTALWSHCLHCYPQEPMLYKVVRVTVLKQLTNSNWFSR